MGNTKFVGELFKMDMLTEKVMHTCIRQLLGDIKKPDDSDVESLCHLMRTVGKKLDIVKAEKHFLQYMDRIERMLDPEVGLPVRLKFLLKGIIDLRKNNWIERKAQVTDGPQTLSEIHKEFAFKEAKEMGKGKGGAPIMIGPPSLALLRSAPPASVPIQSLPGGAGGFGGGPSRGVGGRGGNDGWSTGRGGSSSQTGAASGGLPNDSVGAGVHRPGESGGMYAMDKKLTAHSGTILDRHVGDKRVSIDKTNIPSSEATKLAPEVFQRKTESLMVEYLASGDVDEAVLSLKELRTDFDKALIQMYQDSFEKKDLDRSKLRTLVQRVCEQKVITLHMASAAIKETIALIMDLECDIPKVATYVALNAVSLLKHGLIPFTSLTPAIESYAKNDSRGCKKFVALLAKTLKAEVGEDDARRMWSEAKVDVKGILSLKDSDLNEFLGSEGLEWLFPLLGCRRDLDEALRSGKDASEILAWLKSPSFAGIIMSDLGARCVMRSLLENFGEAECEPNFQKYGKAFSELYGMDTLDMKKLQLEMIYEVQLYCYEKAFQNQNIKRLFMAIYDCEMVLEASFNMWKEDTTDTPGKKEGKKQAVLHANSFLQWLVEAPVEDEDEEASD